MERLVGIKESGLDWSTSNYSRQNPIHKWKLRKIEREACLHSCIALLSPLSLVLACCWIHTADWSGLLPSAGTGNKTVWFPANFIYLVSIHPSICLSRAKVHSMVHEGPRRISHRAYTWGLQVESLAVHGSIQPRHAKGGEWVRSLVLLPSTLNFISFCYWWLWVVQALFHYSCLYWQI